MNNTHITILRSGFSLFLLVTLVGCAVLPSPSVITIVSSAQSDPLSKLAGDWGLTVFVIGGGQFGGPRCGKTDRPGSSPVSIASPGDSGVSLAVACNDGSDYAFRLKHDDAAHTYLITVKSKQGISVDNFPVAYVEGQGWKGAREQLVEGTAVSITATVAPIEGRTWYGWTMVVLPTADIDRGLADIKRPYFKADLTRRK
jgi:hypothetical protein